MVSLNQVLLLRPSLIACNCLLFHCIMSSCKNSTTISFSEFYTCSSDLDIGIGPSVLTNKPGTNLKWSFGTLPEWAAVRIEYFFFHLTFYLLKKFFFFFSEINLAFVIVVISLLFFRQILFSLLSMFHTLLIFIKHHLVVHCTHYSRNSLWNLFTINYSIIICPFNLLSITPFFPSFSHSISPFFLYSISLFPLLLCYSLSHHPFLLAIFSLFPSYFLCLSSILLTIHRLSFIHPISPFLPFYLFSIHLSFASYFLSIPPFLLTTFPFFSS